MREKLLEPCATRDWILCSTGISCPCIRREHGETPVLQDMSESVTQPREPFAISRISTAPPFPHQNIDSLSAPRGASPKRHHDNASSTKPPAQANLPKPKYAASARGNVSVTTRISVTCLIHASIRGGRAEKNRADEVKFKAETWTHIQTSWRQITPTRRSSAEYQRTGFGIFCPQGSVHQDTFLQLPGRFRLSLDPPETEEEGLLVGADRSTSGSGF